jgi:hypothetical protein
MLRPVDGAWLAAFRVLFGLTLAVSMWRFEHYGWVDRLFVQPRMFFKYWGFSWVQPLSGSGMHWLVWSLGGLSLCVAAGLAFRLAAPLFALGLIYLQLIDVSTYLNHYYLAALLALLLAASPAHRSWSLDARLGQRWFGATAPATVSAAWLYLFRFQIGVVYVFAGLAKLQSDWLLHAQPLRIWLGASTSLPILGPLFTVPWVPLAMSWCGFLFDTTIVGFLLRRRTRPYAYVVVVAFHALTRLLLPIGMFPVIMTLGALVFFSPSWPRAAWAWLRRVAPPAAPGPAPRDIARGSQALLGLGILYCVLQLAMPLRFLAYGGNVLWHEQGMRFSWRVMVRAKGGGTTFAVHSASARRTWYVSPRDYLTDMQQNEMSSQPDLILQLAHHIREDFERRGLGPVEVRAESRAALNGRRSALLVDPRVDLGRVQDGLARAPFVLPAPLESPAHTRPVL